ncbi:TIGR03668 family PPOX class F420-dependent oxidoreductase [Phytohabitans sp. ZYX-F-186]|uniref:TIGR03668 family PPOX class F420-dependent oxidoreductase n=1 Tax=Phytohabitans maris TaxID=3071409 RepID=A0ABU0ZQ64_9ACTN|nr:TIGR03668 family PPOX class F420-dependent oxidoreductase [Phytohabitans sp. ZYX-F-186]MDQ7909162.1 TIGR03668 family PPOX class F420-dependent oxidoreductase [Phytohabitans sp. ZYX-F-186]
MDIAARHRFAAARVATLATVDSDGAPHVVPVTFAVDGDTVWSAVDAKPKRSRALRRLDNIRANPRVTMLAHHWDEDWSALWWVRADGLAVVTAEPSTVERVAGLLREKYEQYRAVEVPGPVIRVAVDAWRDWSAT